MFCMKSSFYSETSMHVFVAGAYIGVDASVVLSSRGSESPGEVTDCQISQPSLEDSLWHFPLRS